MRSDTFYHLFVDLLRDLYSAENQIVSMLPKLSNAATDPDLKEALLHHLKETKGQVVRLKRIFKELGESPGGELCEAMTGILKEAAALIKARQKNFVKDAALIAVAQRVEHYEMAGYGAARCYAKHLELNDISQLLQETLDEEGNANKTLTTLAEGGLLSSGINRQAMVTTTTQ